jgi:hypothetical protein
MKTLPYYSKDIGKNLIMDSWMSGLLQNASFMLQELDGDIHNPERELC